MATKDACGHLHYRKTTAHNACNPGLTKTCGPIAAGGWYSCRRSLTSHVGLPSPVRASSTSPVAVCEVIRDAGTCDCACHWTLDEPDRLVERRPARMGIPHRVVLEPDRHATEED